MACDFKNWDTVTQDIYIFPAEDLILGSTYICVAFHKTPRQIFDSNIK
jgi:hypothetical protein